MTTLKEKNNIKLNNALCYGASFVLPVAIMLAAYLSNGIFTRWSILINDLSSQYSAFLLYYRDFMLENGIFYSFSKGFGGNFYGIFTYYLTSPLNLLVFLFPSDRIEIPIAVIILLRFGLSGAAFNWFVQRQRPDCSKITAAAFGVMYALVSYMTVLCYHLPWGDVYFMLPVITAFLLDIFKGKSPVKFTIAFTFMLISNYYMAYMVAIFCVLMFLHSCIVDADIKKSFKVFITLAKSAAVSAALCAWLWLPTIFALMQGKFTIPDDRFFAFGIGSFLSKLFVGSYDSVGNISAPFIYCGAASFALFTLGFFIKNKSVKEKIADILVVAALFLSMWIVPLNKVWHMFAAPNAFPYRFTYIAVFFVLWKAFEACCEVKKIPALIVALAGVVWIVFMAAVKAMCPSVPLKNFLFTAMVAAAVAALLWLVRVMDKKLPVLLIALVMVGDMAVNAQLLVGKNYEMLAKEPAGNFRQQYLATKSQLETIDDEGFYRMFNIKNILNEADYTENTVFQHGYNELYRGFTSLTEDEHEQFKSNVLSGLDNDVRGAMFGVKYNLKNQQITPTGIGTFPLMYKTVKKPDSYSYDVRRYIVDATGCDVFYDDGGVDVIGLNNAIIAAQTNGAENISVNKNKITAVINSDTDNQFVAANIIWDDGWTVRVNGEKKVKHRVLQNLTGFYVNSGVNTIEMVYVPKGFKAGTIISALSAAIVAVYLLKKKYKQ